MEPELRPAAAEELQRVGYQQQSKNVVKGLNIFTPFTSTKPEVM